MRSFAGRSDGARRALVCSILLLTFYTSVAYPNYFLSRNLGLNSTDRNCVAHPNYTSRGHGTPTMDSGILFEILNNISNTPIDLLCPGEEYTLKVSFGGVPRAALLNSNPPLVSFSMPAPTSGCRNQIILGMPVQNESYTTKFTIPCDTVGTQLMFKVTSVGKDDYRWKYASWNVTVADATSSAAALGRTCAAAAASCASRSCAPSHLGYDCMATWRNITVHWSANSTVAPINPCTPLGKTILQAEEVSGYGSLHMAVQSAAAGYVSLGFAVSAGMMVPSDIILGWMNSSLASSVQSFDASKTGWLSAATENTFDSWAYDRGVSYNASSGVTTLCFSRRMADPRALSVPDLRQGAGLLAINYAVSEEDAVVKHKPGSVGGFYLDLLRGIVPVSSPPPPRPPAPLSPVATSTPSSPESTSPDGTTNAARSCTPSSLGYQCMAQKGKVTVHWTYGTNAAPTNPCTPSTKTILTDEELAQYGTLHIAAQSATEGYVGLGFAENPGNMYRSDIVMGWIDGSGAPWVNTFHATSNGLDMEDVVRSSWAYETGVSRTSAGVITICFSRRLVDSRATASPDLRAVVGNGSSSSYSSSSGSSQLSSVGGRRRLTEDARQSTQQLGLIWAISPSARLTKHLDDDAGGFYLDVSSGSLEETSDGGKSKRYWVEVHGALMAVAWGLMLPLGTLLPAHRWLLGDAKVAGKHVWFWLHMTCQLTGMGMFIAGFVVAFVQFDFSGSPEVAEAHENIGIAVMAAAASQLVLGHIRPAPEHPRRGLWNLLHHNLGRLTILLSWANVYIGIYLAHSSWGASFSQWVCPIAITMGLLVLLDVVLRLLGRVKTSAESSARPEVYIVNDDISPTKADAPSTRALPS